MLPYDHIVISKESHTCAVRDGVGGCWFGSLIPPPVGVLILDEFHTTGDCLVKLGSSDAGLA